MAMLWEVKAAGEAGVGQAAIRAAEATGLEARALGQVDIVARLKRAAREADAAAWIGPVDSPGWASLRSACMAMGKPRKDFDPAAGDPGDLVRYLEESGAATLLVVGPREHERPGIEAAALEYLAAALGMFCSGR